jgi:hypothetical protein
VIRGGTAMKCLNFLNCIHGLELIAILKNSCQ